jgi:hypothetical protein
MVRELCYLHHLPRHIGIWYEEDEFPVDPHSHLLRMVHELGSYRRVHHPRNLGATGLLGVLLGDHLGSNWDEIHRIAVCSYRRSGAIRQLHHWRLLMRASWFAAIIIHLLMLLLLLNRHHNLTIVISNKTQQNNDENLTISKKQRCRNSAIKNYILLPRLLYYHIRTPNIVPMWALLVHNIPGYTTNWIRLGSTSYPLLLLRILLLMLLLRHKLVLHHMRRPLQRLLLIGVVITVAIIIVVMRAAISIFLPVHLMLLRTSSSRTTTIAVRTWRSAVRALLGVHGRVGLSLIVARVVVIVIIVVIPIPAPTASAAGPAATWAVITVDAAAAASPSATPATAD